MAACAELPQRDRIRLAPKQPVKMPISLWIPRSGGVRFRGAAPSADPLPAAYVLLGRRRLRILGSETRMVVRGRSVRSLLLVLAVGLTAQALALAAHHPPLRIVTSTRGGDDQGSAPHDPSTCNLCQIIAQVRVQGPALIGYDVPTAVLEWSSPAPAPATPASIQEPLTSSPRAPPSSSVS